MRERRRKFISLLLMVIMVVTLIPSMAFADGSHVHNFDETTHACSCGAHEDCTSHEGWIGLTQNDFESKTAHVWNSEAVGGPKYSLGFSDEHKYYLAEDITLPASVNIGDAFGVSVFNVDLCLNGHVIDCNQVSEAFKIYGNSTLSIYDCKDTVHYFTDEKKYDDEEEEFVDGKDNCFETLQSSSYDISGKTEGADYVAVYGGVFTNAVTLFAVWDSSLPSNKPAHLNLYAGTIIGCHTRENLISLKTECTKSSLKMNGVTIRNNFIANDDSIIYIDMATSELSDCSIFSNTCGQVIDSRGDEEHEIDAALIIKDSSIYNNTLLEHGYAIYCSFCNVTLEGEVIIKNNLNDGQEHNFVSSYYIYESQPIVHFAKSFSINNLTSDKNSIGLSLMDSIKEGESVEVSTNAGAKSDAFFSDDILYYPAGDNGSLKLNHRIKAQPSEDNNYTFNVYTDDLNSSTYQWYPSELQTKNLDDTNTEACKTFISGSYSSGVWTPSTEDGGWSFGLFSFNASENAAFKCDLDFNGANLTNEFQFGVINEAGDVMDSIIVTGDSTYEFTSPKGDIYSLQGCFGREKESIDLTVKNARLEENVRGEPVVGQTTNTLTSGSDNTSYICEATLKDKNNIEKVILYSNPVLFVGRTTFTVTFDANGGTCDTPSAETGTDGNLTSLPTATRSGYTFNGWYTAPSGGEKITTSKVFTANETVFAQWTAEHYSGGGTSSYAVELPANIKNGKVDVSPKNASAGQTVTLTVTPDKGFTLETLTVLDKNGKEVEVKNLGNNKFSFKMPSGKASISATFMEDNSMLNFCVDVKASDYYYDAVLWAYENEICKGTDAVHFSPSAPVTRAQVVTFLWRAAGCPEPVGDASRFVDVEVGGYYEKAVAWAIEQVITKGTSETTFTPDAVCTRGQIAAFLARFAGVADEATGYTHGFTDVNAADYFNNAVAWAKNNKVTEGTSTTTFSPNDDCIRAQVVTFLYRWMVK